MIPASMPMMASTQRISISAKPASLPTKPAPPRAFSARAAGDISRCSTAALLTVGAEGNDVVGRPLAGRAIDVAVAPGIVGHHAAAQIWAVPARRIVAARQRRQPFTAVRIAPEIEIIEIERAGKTLDLDLGGLRLGLAEIVEDARSDQRHDQADDGDHHEDFDQRETGLRPLPASRRLPYQIWTHQ